MIKYFCKHCGNELYNLNSPCYCKNTEVLVIDTDKLDIDEDTGLCTCKCGETYFELYHEDEDSGFSYSKCSKCNTFLVMYDRDYMYEEYDYEEYN